MKPHEAHELATILQAKKNLEDAQTLLYRGKRTQLKRIELLTDAMTAIGRQLQSYPLTESEPKVVQQPDLGEQREMGVQ